jgi:putative transposase
MARVAKRAYRYRFYSSPEQAAELSRTFGCVRLAWNKALDARTSAWYQRREHVSYVQSSAMLTQWKAGDDLAFLNEVSCVPLQQALRHLQGAFASFWEKRSGYPRFKSRKQFRASAEYTRSAFRWRDGELTLAKMSEPLDIRWSRPLPEGAEPSTVTVSRDPAGRWHVSLLCECPVEALPPLETAVGIDAGITSLLTLSTGEKIANPRHERRDRLRLAKAQRKLSRKAKGSANRAISDASWSECRRMLEYKADWYGRTVVAVDRFYPSSKTCSACGHIAASMPLSGRDWACPACGAIHDRDANAAVNIRAAGLSVLACGGTVRPDSRKRERRVPVKQEIPVL